MKTDRERKDEVEERGRIRQSGKKRAAEVTGKLSPQIKSARVPLGTQTLEQPSPRTAHGVKVLGFYALSKKSSVILK
jgi:hypothetical protein